MIRQEELETLLDESAVTTAFRSALAAYRRGEPQDHIMVAGYAPPIKVERLLTKIVEELPDEVINTVQIDARSGCSNFTGRCVLQPSNVQITFDWDCAWKAEVEGLRSYGFPDQQRAVEEFGYDCFRIFEVVH